MRQCRIYLCVCESFKRGGSVAAKAAAGEAALRALVAVESSNSFDNEGRIACFCRILTFLPSMCVVRDVNSARMRGV